MEQQPFAASTEVQKLAFRPDTTCEDTPLEMTELHEVERTTDGAEQRSVSSAATAAKLSIMPLPSAAEIIPQGRMEVQKLCNVVAKKPGTLLPRLYLMRPLLLLSPLLFPLGLSLSAL